MENKINVGDIVKSIAGRDKGNYFIVLSVLNNKATFVDGKIHKINKPKVKNLKHLELILTEKGKTYSDKINQGKPTGNEKVFREIKACIKK